MIKLYVTLADFSNLCFKTFIQKSNFMLNAVTNNIKDLLSYWVFEKSFVNFGLVAFITTLIFQH